MYSLSLIIPIYNVEKYITDCLDSIYTNNKNLSEFEVICVDDCGNDKSISIIEKYIVNNRIENCKIIHHTSNKGLSGARNTGAKFASGDYLMFLDSDDYLAPEGISKILKYIKENIYDIVEINCKEILENDVTKVYLSSVKHITSFSSNSGLEYLNNKLTLKEYYPMSVTKIVRKRVFQETGGFYEGILFEDEDYTPRLYLCAQKCISYDDALYIYRRREGSITTSAFSNKKWLNSYDIIINRLLSLCNEISDMNLHDNLYNHICNMTLSILKNCSFYGLQKDIIQKAKKLYMQRKYQMLIVNSKKGTIKLQGYISKYPSFFIFLFKAIYSIKGGEKNE